MYNPDNLNPQLLRLSPTREEGGIGIFQTNLLHHILISFQAVNFILFLYFSIFRRTDPFSTTIAILGFFLFFILYILFRLNLVKLTLHSASILMLSIPASALYFGNGLYDTTIILYPIFFLVLSLLHHGRFYLLYTGIALLSILTIGILGYIEHSSNLQDIGLIAFFLILSAVINRYTLLSFARMQNEKEGNDRIYQEIFDGVEDGVLIYSAQTGSMLEANQAAVRIYGRNKKDLLKCNVLDLSSGAPPYSMKDAKTWIRKSFTEGPQQLLWRARKGDGSFFWAEVTLKFLLIQGEKRVVVIIRDIDKIQTLEKQLHQSEKLYALGQMAGGIAHDFNNQLMGIQGFTELLHYDIPRETRVKYLDMIEKSVTRASDLTNNLLSFARKGKKSNKPVEIVALVNETVEFIKRGIDQQIDIQTELPGEEIFVTGDASQLENALLNLGLNGRDAINGKGCITFSVQKTELSPNEIRESYTEYQDLTAGSFVQIDVCDTGTGIHKKIENKVFDPFFTTKENDKGTGLGLSAVYGTVRQHKGIIYFTSEVGKGTQFTLMLPLQG